MFPEHYVLVSLQLAKKLRESSTKHYLALFHIIWPEGLAPPPPILTPSDSSWNWKDPSFVKLPISSEYTLTEVDIGKKQTTTPKWEIIQRELFDVHEQLCSNLDGKPVNYAKLLKNAISKYHPIKTKNYNFEILNDPTIAEKLKICLRIIVKHAFELETQLAEPIPILESGKSQTILLSRYLCCSLLANAFFCTFPEQSREILPDFNFFPLFHKGENDSRSNVKVEKLKCILEYFHQMGTTSNETNTVISFERRCMATQVQWKNSTEKLCPLAIERNKGIEDAESMLQVDFANKIVGGGVLNEGAVMEEIRFVLSPELIAARLFTEPLRDDEVLVVTGTRQFSLYSGYSGTFKFAGPRNLKAQKDDLGREVTQVVAMDAYQFTESNQMIQYTKEMVDRELHKCLVGFVKRKVNDQAVATGNWGCGAFNGDPQIKFLIQWMAASHVKRTSLLYHTHRNERQAKELEEMSKHLRQKEVTVGVLYNCLLRYHQKNVNVHPSSRSPIFAYVKNNI